MNERDLIPAELFSQWSVLQKCTLQESGGGLINLTFLAQSEEASLILQRVNPIFQEEVHLDIEAITQHLEGKGFLTPRLIPTDDGGLFARCGKEIWRLQSAIDGKTIHQIRSPKQAFEAGKLVASFHQALGDLTHDYHFSRGNVHDTCRHLQSLRNAMEEHASHPLRGEMTPTAELILQSAKDIPAWEDLPLRHCHGDLKISNLLFDEDDRALCLIDLDTLSRMKWPHEMGDALRSWCNPHAEENEAATLDLTILEAALRGYGAEFPTPCSAEETAALVEGMETICLELSARFLSDALSESYFGWDPSRHPSRGHHNLARGKAMYHLFEDILKKRSQAMHIIEKTLGP